MKTLEIRCMNLLIFLGLLLVSVPVHADGLGIIAKLNALESRIVTLETKNSDLERQLNTLRNKKNIFQLGRINSCKSYNYRVPIEGTTTSDYVFFTTNLSITSSIEPNKINDNALYYFRTDIKPRNDKQSIDIKLITAVNIATPAGRIWECNKMPLKGASQITVIAIKK